MTIATLDLSTVASGERTPICSLPVESGRMCIAAGAFPAESAIPFMHEVPYSIGGAWAASIAGWGDGTNLSRIAWGEGTALLQHVERSGLVVGAEAAFIRDDPQRVVEQLPRPVGTLRCDGRLLFGDPAGGSPRPVHMTKGDYVVVAWMADLGYISGRWSGSHVARLGAYLLPCEPGDPR